MAHLKELWEALRGKDHPDFKKQYGMLDQTAAQEWSPTDHRTGP
jgi:hypothetical protein